jgi:hypothetical protein
VRRGAPLHATCGPMQDPTAGKAGQITPQHSTAALTPGIGMKPCGTMAVGSRRGLGQQGAQRATHSGSTRRHVSKQHCCAGSGVCRTHRIKAGEAQDSQGTSRTKSVCVGGVQVWCLSPYCGCIMMPGPIGIMLPDAITIWGNSSSSSRR